MKHFVVRTDFVSGMVNKLMMAITPAKIVQSETAAETYKDNGDESGLFTNIRKVYTWGCKWYDHINSCSDHQLSVAEMQKIQFVWWSKQQNCAHFIHLKLSRANEAIEKLLHWYKHLLAERSPTAKLWIQYIEYVETLKIFIRAERIGDWNLYLITVKKMLNLFAPTGHSNCAKSASFYLQLMMQLPSDHPWLYQCFIQKGYHTIRTSYWFWASLWTDLTIEQVLMKSAV